MPKAHPADPRPTAERSKPRPSESRKHARLRLHAPEPDKYPNLHANAALERALHILRAMEQGLTRKEAEQHADEHLGASGHLDVTPRKRPRKAAARPAKAARRRD